MSSVSDNRRIVKNTIFLYSQTLFTLIIALYTSRVILDALGVEDYGIYNVVGGISMSFIFLSSTLSNATHRYLNFAIGENNTQKVGQIFNQNLIIYFIYALVSILLVELVGGWLVNNELTIPSERIEAANWVLHSTSITLFITIITSVYESVLISRENMKVYAYIGIYDAFTKLLIAISLNYVTFDKLKIYSLLVVLAIISSKIFLISYTSSKYSETRLKFYWNKDLFKEMFKFSGWTLVGALTFLLNDQGINILLNMFFGPVVNAARGVSVQVKSAITSFSAGSITAMRPQIVKTYAANELEEYKSLIFNCGKYSFFLLWMICVPVLFRIDSLLDLWLKEVPMMVDDFVLWLLIFSLINTLCDAFWQGVQAVGKIKKYIIIGNMIYVLAFPISWLAFKLGASPIIAYQVIAIIRLIYLIVVFNIFRQYVYISVNEYFNKVIFPIFKTVLLSTIIATFINMLIPQGHIMYTFIACAILLLVTIVSILLVGIGQQERMAILDRLNTWCAKIIS